MQTIDHKLLLRRRFCLGHLQMFGTPWHANVRDARKPCCRCGEAHHREQDCMRRCAVACDRKGLWARFNQVQSCVGSETHMKQYSGKVKLADKTGQLSCYVFWFPAKQQAESSSFLPKIEYSGDALTNCPVTELKLVQTAYLCYKCTQLQGLIQTTACTQSFARALALSSDSVADCWML